MATITTPSVRPVGNLTGLVMTPHVRNFTFIATNTRITPGLFNQPLLIDIRLMLWPNTATKNTTPNYQALFPIIATATPLSG